jgi:hypothetical protein
MATFFFEADGRAALDGTVLDRLDEGAKGFFVPWEKERFSIKNFFRIFVTL